MTNKTFWKLFTIAVLSGVLAAIAMKELILRGYLS